MSQSANPISSVETIEMPLEDAIKIIGAQVPDTMEALSREYGGQVWASIENKEYTKERSIELGHAYLTMTAEVLAKQIEKDGRFDLSTVDFSILDDVQIYDRTDTGVEICEACHGAGGLIMFKKKPTEVECLKCKEQDFYFFDKKQQKEVHIVISGNVLKVDDVVQEEKSRFSWMLGRRVEDCLSCGGTGRFRTEPMKDLIINVQCKTCRETKYHKDSEKTQVLAKCKTCKGKRRVKIPTLVGVVKSKTPCKVCGSLGFVRPRPALDNPVITKDLAATIKSM